MARIDTEEDGTSTAYDKAGNVIQTTDAKSHNAYSTYDARSQKLSHADRESGVTTWRYDQNGNLLHLTDGDNQQADHPTIWTYNLRNQKTSEALPGHDPASSVGYADYDKKNFAYDLVGRPGVFYDQLGDTVTHTFDMANRLTQRDYRLEANSPSGTIANSDELAYDDAGRLLTAESGRYNNTVTNVYGDAGRVTSESITVNFGSETTYTTTSQYDDVGRRTQITYPDSTVVTRSYTGRDQLYQIGYDSNNVATYSYDDSGRRTGRTLGDSSNTATAWTYGRDDNFVTAITTSGIATFGYTYDANKNKLTETLGSPMANYGFDSTTYDDEDRLTAWSRVDDNKDQSWNLSEVGDWESFTEEGNEVERTHDAVHQLTAIDQTSLTHDAKGNITVNANAQEYVWDFDNRMSSYNNGEYGYTYDALGRRVSKTVVIGGGGQGARRPGLGSKRAGVRPGGSSLGSKRAGSRPGGLGSKKAGSTSITTVYVSDGHQVLSEYKDSGSGTSLVQQRKFVYASYIDEPVLMLDVDGETETKYYYHQNNLYSVATLTNQAGTVVERYSNLAYGAVTFHDANGDETDPQPTTGSPVGNPYLFTGRRLDPETGLFYYRARYYSTDLGRFISRDPIGYAADLSLYQYARGMPLVVIDPTGGCGSPPPECKCCCADKLTGPHKNKPVDYSIVGGGRTFGTEYDVTATMCWIDDAPPMARGKDCRFDWYHFSTAPKQHLPDGYASGSWNNEMAIVGTSFFKDVERTYGCPEVVSRTDEALYHNTSLLDIQNTSYYAIRVRSAEGCPCEEAGYTDPPPLLLQHNINSSTGTPSTVFQIDEIPTPPGMPPWSK